MAKLTFEGVGISAMSAAVPSNTINNLEYSNHFPPDQTRQVVEKIGVYERRFAEPGTCSSDLCSAAEKLFTDNQMNRDEIDLLVFVSQTPDYRMPATSLLLQDRLGLSQDTIAVDLNLGCSGFIYGLLTGETPEEAVRLGWAHGALLTTFPGDTTMATVEQVRAFAKGGSARIQR